MRPWGPLSLFSWSTWSRGSRDINHRIMQMSVMMNVRTECFGENSCADGSGGGAEGRKGAQGKLRSEGSGRKPDPAGQSHLWVCLQKQWETFDEFEPEFATF